MHALSLCCPTVLVLIPVLPRIGHLVLDSWCLFPLCLCSLPIKWDNMGPCLTWLLEEFVKTQLCLELNPLFSCI